MPVQIGFLEEAEEPLVVDPSQPSTFPSKVGGKPLWLDPTNPLRASDVTCAKCNVVMPLLMQLYTPEHGGDAYHRVVYVFCCKNGACMADSATQSVRAFRTQLPKTNPHLGSARKPYEAAPTCTVCGLHAPFRCSRCRTVQYCAREHQVHHWTAGGHKEACAEAIAAAAQANGNADSTESGLGGVQKKEAAKTDPKKDLAWPELELVDEEEPPAPPESKLAASWKNGSSAAANDDDDVDERGFAQERYERYSAGVDVQFLRFQKRVARAGDQVIRYARTDDHSDNEDSSDDDDDGDDEPSDADSDSRSDSDSDSDAAPSKSFSKLQVVPHPSAASSGAGAHWKPPPGTPTPLWASQGDRPAPGDVPDCERCGGKRGFEFQIMPPLLMHLPINHLARDALDFGTLLLFTCEASCTLSTLTPNPTPTTSANGAESRTESDTATVPSSAPDADPSRRQGWSREIIWRQLFSSEGARVGGGGGAMKADRGGGGKEKGGKGKGKERGKKGKAKNKNPNGKGGNR